MCNVFTRNVVVHVFSCIFFLHQDDADVATAKTEFDQLYRDALGGFDDMQAFDDLEG